jgi:hypothetical protein
MARRDAFSKLKGSSTILNVEDGVQCVNSPATESLASGQPLDLIPTAQRRKKRNRDWEQAHRAETVTYRGIPRECHHWVEEIAGGLAVPRDEVIRAFLEYGEERYRRGELRLYAYPKSRRMTLYPGGDLANTTAPVQTKEITSWLSEAFPVVTHREASAKKPKGKTKPEPAWQVRVTYRIPVGLKEKVRTIAETHTLPVGEVVRFFIEHSLLAFRNGDFTLQPAPKLIGKTLFQDHPA